MPGNAKEFITLYNTLDSLLRKKLKLRDYADYASLVTKAREDKFINDNQKDYLSLVGKLRNAIIHDDRFKYPDDPIAEPHPEIIAQLKKLLEIIENPPTVGCLPKHKPEIFQSADLLLDCLQYMRENDFSQVVVFDGEKHALITREDIARWFEKQIDQKDIVVSLENIQLAEVLTVDNKADCRFLPHDALLPEIVEKFDTREQARIAAVLITHHGKSTETPMNIFTQYDIPEILSKIDSF